MKIFECIVDDGETSLICALLKEHIDKVGTRF